MGCRLRLHIMYLFFYISQVSEAFCSLKLSMKPVLEKYLLINQSYTPPPRPHPSDFPESTELLNRSE